MKKTISIIISLSVIVWSTLPLVAFADFTAECTGGTITHSGSKTIHVFTSGGTFDCTGSGSDNVEVLVVGGGGGGAGVGGNLTGAGGGGAGGYQYNAAYAISSTSYSVTIGSGGSGGSNNQGGHGGDSIFDAITATGGGAGQYGNMTSPSLDGGSGGGGSNNNTGGSGSQGNNGGNASGAEIAGGGGGGADTAGANGHSSQAGGNGGNGIQNSISGTLTYYAGGGGGGSNATGGIGGLGGGGNGGGSSQNSGTSGDANTGGGGGGGGTNGSGVGGAGGSGIVIISYDTPVPPLPLIVTGSGTINRIAKFIASTTIADTLLSDDGTNILLTSGNFFMPVSSLFDTFSAGPLNFGTLNATTMTFGSSTQKMIINSKVGISTSTPSADLDVNGSIFARFINLLADGLGIDTLTSGILNIGSTTASAINIGHGGATTTISGPLKITNIGTISNCNSSASPAVCGSASSGSVAMPTGGSTLVVNTTAVTANSQIFITEDSSLGSRLGITCNTTTGRVYSINARVSTTSPSFTIKSSANPAGNKACLSYFIVN